MTESLTLRGELRGHTGWVTSIATPLEQDSDLLVTSSRCVERSVRLDTIVFYVWIALCSQRDARQREMTTPSAGLQTHE